MLATKRLQRELVALQKESPQFVRAKPMESNILNFHYVLEGPPGSPYAGGFYHGVLKFPSEYPHKPPSVIMYTPSGRFVPAQRICMSMSDFHPESWNPVWSIASILVGLQSFMLETAQTVGSCESTTEMKRQYALETLGYNVQNKDFCRLFPELVELHDKRKADAAVAGAGSGGAGASAAAATKPDAGSSMRHVLLLVAILVAVLVAYWKRSSAAATNAADVAGGGAFDDLD